MTPRTPPVGEADPGSLVTIGRFIEPVGAELSASRLKAEGLDCYLQGLGPSSLLPTGTICPILLQVRAADADHAREILNEQPRAGAVPGEPPLAGSGGDADPDEPRP
jgi:hypothetical protein